MKKQRTWVKWALLVFFAVLAFLTFFSGTIRNLTLPQVSVQQVTAGTITPMISGSGVVQAGESTQVAASYAGSVIKVCVQPEDAVNKNDVLLVVSYQDDGTLAAKQAELAQQEAAYAEAQLSATATSNSGALAEYQILQNNLTSAKEQQARCQEYLGKRAELDSQLAAANSDLSAAQAAYHTATDAAAQEAAQAHEALDAALRQQENAQANYNYYAGLDPESEEALAAKADLDAASTAVLDCQNRCYAADNALQALQAQYQPPVDAAQQRVDSINSQISALEAEYAGCTDPTVCENAVLAARSALSAFYDRQSSAKVQDELTANRLAAMQAQIEQTKREISELEARFGEHDILADRDGVVKDVWTEETFPAGQALISLQSQNSYTLRCSVPIADTELLQVGAEASVLNYPAGGVHAVLTAIEQDETDPVNQKTLVFSVSGEHAAAWQLLTLGISLESSRHALVVPNAALWRDARGDFVYVLETTNSPLGSRSKVKRVDVEVVRSDERYTAVNGELNTQDYVVVLAGAPLSDGQAVRLGD